MPHDVNTLFPVVYGELRRLAHSRRRAVAAGETLRTTALVHEAYLKLAEQSSLDIQDREHFFALAARVIRQVLVDADRRRSADKRGNDATHLPLEDVTEPGRASNLVDVLALDAAMNRLHDVDPRLCQIVELRVFCGLTVEETADLIKISVRTVKRDWRKARAFLWAELGL
jgi:RNA polymerase sigma factor (TIGR02999 family)